MYRLSQNPFCLVGQVVNLRRDVIPPPGRLTKPPQVNNLPHKLPEFKAVVSGTERGTGFSLCFCL
jgi:hypothetical protein